MFVSDKINKLHIKLCWWRSGQKWTLYRLYSLPKRPGSHVRILVQTWLQIRTPTIQFTSIQKKVGKLSTKRCGIKTLYLVKHWMETFQGNISRIVWLNPHQSMNWIILSERSDNYLLHVSEAPLLWNTNIVKRNKVWSRKSNAYCIIWTKNDSFFLILRM